MTEINLYSPEYLASLRKSAEHMRDHNLVLQDVRGEVTLALLDALHEARTAYLNLHGGDFQKACNEREALRERVKELESQATPAHKRLARDNLPGLEKGAPLTFKGARVLLEPLGDVMERTIADANQETLAERHERLYGRPHPVLDMLARKP
jgi:hypothetical protein